MPSMNRKKKKGHVAKPPSVAAKTSPPSSATSAEGNHQTHNKVTVTIDSEALQAALAHQDSSFLGAIDQGTSSTRFLVVSSQGRIVGTAQVETTQYYPQPGWHEQDPHELWDSVVLCAHSLQTALQDQINSNQSSTLTLKALGMTNQRETTLAWNRTTGTPYYNAIVWDDLRTTEIAQTIRRTVAMQDRQNPPQDDHDTCSLTRRTGLPVASYFAGTKVRWLVENVPSLAKDLAECPEQVCFGTVDVWLAYQLTGTETLAQEGSESSNKTFSSSLHRGGLFVTDATNASRWMFMDLTTQTWDKELIDMVLSGTSVKLPLSTLPAIHPSSHLFGECSSLDSIPPILRNVPLAAILGDQQAALFGQTCFSPGEAKNTYGTGLFLMMVTGDQPVRSTHGLLTTIAYQIGGKTTYALEGSVAHSGSTIQWLRDQLNMIEQASDTERLASPRNDGVYFVPAFAGLFAPYWRPDARACLVGLTSSHGKKHICRAVLEAIAYQTKDVFDAIEKDSTISLKSLRVDGGGTANQMLMQFQADVINVPVECPVILETTAMGAAYAAGLAVGVWKDLDEIKSLWSVAKTFEASMPEEERLENIRGWEKAVSKSLGWVDSVDTKNILNRMESAIVEDEYADAFSQVSELDKAMELARLDHEKSKVLVWNVLSHVVLAAGALAVGYMLGERKPGLTSGRVNGPFRT